MSPTPPPSTSKNTSNSASMAPSSPSHPPSPSPPVRPITHEFRFTLDDPGIHHGQILLVEDDASALDNRLSFALNIDPASASGHHQAPPARNPPGRRRLLPRTCPRLRKVLASPPSPPTSSPPPPSPARPSSSASTSPPSNPTPHQLLAAYAHNGGHLVWIAGPNVDPDAYNQMNQQARRQSPARSPGPPARPCRGHAQGSWHIASLDATHPVLASPHRPPLSLPVRPRLPHTSRIPEPRHPPRPGHPRRRPTPPRRESPVGSGLHPLARRRRP